MSEFGITAPLDRAMMFICSGETRSAGFYKAGGSFNYSGRRAKGGRLTPYPVAEEKRWGVARPMAGGTSRGNKSGLRWPHR